MKKRHSVHFWKYIFFFSMTKFEYQVSIPAIALVVLQWIDLWVCTTWWLKLNLSKFSRCVTHLQSSLLSIWPFIIYQNKTHSCSTHRVAFPAILPPPHSHSISLAGWEHHHCGGAAAPGSHSQPITESLQPADYSVDSTASFNRHSRTTRQQDTGAGGRAQATASERQCGQNKEHIRIRVGVCVCSLFNWKM